MFVSLHCTVLTTSERPAAAIDFKQVNSLREGGKFFLQSKDYKRASLYYSAIMQIIEGIGGVESLELRRRCALTLAECEIKLGNLQRAVARCSEVIDEATEPENWDDIDPNVALSVGKAFYKRGISMKRLNKPHFAWLDFEKCLMYNPNNEKAFLEISTLDEDTADYKTAKKDADDRDDDVIGASLGRALITPVNGAEDSNLDHIQDAQIEASTEATPKISHKKSKAQNNSTNTILSSKEKRQKVPKKKSPKVCSSTKSKPLFTVNAQIESDTALLEDYIDLIEQLQCDYPRARFTASQIRALSNAAKSSSSTRTKVTASARVDPFNMLAGNNRGNDAGVAAGGAGDLFSMIGESSSMGGLGGLGGLSSLLGGVTGEGGLASLAGLVGMLAPFIGLDAKATQTLTEVAKALIDAAQCFQRGLKCIQTNRQTIVLTLTSLWVAVAFLKPLLLSLIYKQQQKNMLF